MHHGAVTVAAAGAVFPSPVPRVPAGLPMQDDADLPSGGGSDDRSDKRDGRVDTPEPDGELLSVATESLPPYACRAARIAGHVAAVLGMPAALVDFGGNEGAFGVGQPAFDLDAIVAGWTPPATRKGPAKVDVAGATCVAFPLTVGGREAWIAAVAGEPRPLTPEAAAVQALVTEFEDDARVRRAALSAWVRRLEDEHQRIERAHRLVGIGTLVHEIAAGILEASPSAAHVLGRAAVDDLDELLAAFDPFDRSLVRAAMLGTLGEADTFDIHRDVIVPGGGRRAVRLHGEVQRRGGAPVRVFALLQDVTAERARLEEMRELAEHDPLTGVANRTVFERAVSEASRLADRERLHAALLLVDVDRFKEINDTLGHLAGDAVLKHVARALVSLTRASDTVLRLAGDEFAVIVTRAAEPDGLVALAERIASTLATTVQVADGAARLSVSIGVAVYPDDVTPSVDIYRAADEALFAAKAAGRGRVRRFDPATRARKESRRAMLARVRAGLARGEFVPFFQPKLDLATGTVVGFEALCRWDHPEHGILGPSAFLPAFEDVDVGGPLSDVTLVGSFAAARRFREKGLPFGHIAINLARVQLERDDLVDRVRRLQAEHQVTASEIVFEVLENVLIRDQKNVYRNLTDLYRLGFRVALDDFGTGFASLTHIREPFIREVKIDRSFVSQAVSNPNDLQIVAAIVQMARKLGLTLVAEGIEDEETLRRLTALGCAVGQGFVFSEALPFASAEEFLARQGRIHALLEKPRA